MQECTPRYLAKKVLNLSQNEENKLGINKFVEPLAEIK